MSRGARLARRAGAWLLATALLVACFREVDGPRALEAMADARPAWLLAAVAAHLAIVVLWAVQWVLFLPRRRRIPLPAMLHVTSVMAMVANSVPLMAGQVTGFHLLATRKGVGHAASLSVTTLDQLSEGLAKVTLLALLGALTPLPEPLRAGLLALPAAVALLALLTLAGALRHAPLRLASRRARARWGTPWPARALAFAARWAHHLEGARRPRVLAGGYALALGMKAAEAAGIVAVQAALGVPVPWWGVLLVLAAVGVATMVSVAPGNLGVYEGSAFLAYRWLGVGAEAALALALLQHLTYLAAMGGAGWAAVTLAALRRRPAEGAAEGERTPAPLDAAGRDAAAD